jgi:outer membrane protein TolC
MKKWQSAVARPVASLMICLGLALPALAQDPATTPGAPTALTAQQTPPLLRPIPTRTVGLEPGKVLRWTLRDAIISALEKNVDIEIERESVRLATYDIFAAQGFYDPNLTSAISYNAVKRPNAFIFSGTSANFVQQDTLTYNFGLTQEIERTGGNYIVNFNNNRVTSNTNNFTPQFSPNLGLQFIQPIFKNLSIDSNRRQIKISKKRLDLSDALFRQRAIEIISRVQAAYWDLALAIRDEEIQRDAAKLAETQLTNNQRQVEVGMLAPIDVVSAATVLESRRQQVFQAMNIVATAENALKNLTVESPTSDLWSTQIIPVEPFEVQPISLPLTDAVKLAVENRPELRQFALQREIN